MTAELTASRGGRRQAFTLLELLIVVSIISVLVAVGLGAYWVVLGSTQVHTTRTLLKSTQTAVDKNWSAVTAQARKDPIPPAFEPTTPSDQRRADYIRTVQQQAFPTSFLLAQTSPIVNYQNYLAANGLGGVTAITSCNPPLTTAPVSSIPALESSICLLMALERGPGGAVVMADDLGQTNVRTFTINGGTTPVRALVDRWGQPIWFVFQQTSASGQNQFTPLLISSGRDMTFNATYNTQPVPPPAGDDLGSK